MCRKRLSSPRCRSELIDSALVVIVPICGNAYGCFCSCFIRAIVFILYTCACCMRMRMIRKTSISTLKVFSNVPQSVAQKCGTRWRMFTVTGVCLCVCVYYVDGLSLCSKDHPGTAPLAKGRLSFCP